HCVAAELGGATGTGCVCGGQVGSEASALLDAMEAICKKIGAERATPHDLRRTFSTAVTRLGFGKDAMNRVTNHREGGISSVYDRHGYADENRRIMEAVASHVVALVEGRRDNVIPIRQA